MTIECIGDTLKRIPAVLAGYESPAEECLGERLRPGMCPRATFQTQVWVNTDAGQFRLDILLTDPAGRRIAIEVDGKNFHDARLDHWRTIFILAAKQADVLYRVAASRLKNDLGDVLADLAFMEPKCFNQQVLAQWRSVKKSYICSFGPDAHACNSRIVKLYYDFAKSTGLTDLGAIQREWDARHA
jgi:hypothetical protein